MRKPLRADLSLALSSLLWGATFVVVKNALGHASVFIFLAVRFSLAAVLMLAWSSCALRQFEREDLFAGFRRLLKADDVTTDFKSAVFRFTDDTDELIPLPSRSSAPQPAHAAGLAAELEPRLLEETRMNLSARQLESILNKETPGFFLAQFEGEKPGASRSWLTRRLMFP